MVFIMHNILLVNSNDAQRSLLNKIICSIIAPKINYLRFRALLS